MFEVPLDGGPVIVKLRDPADGELAGRWRWPGGHTLEVDFLSERLLTVDGREAENGGVMPGFVAWPRLTFEVNGRPVELVSDDEEVLRRHYCRPHHQEVAYTAGTDVKPDPFLVGFHQARIGQVRRVLAGVSGRVLDVGSGYSLVNAAGPWGFALFACDRDPAAAAHLRAAGVGAAVANVDAPPFREGCFDAVYAGEIVEHLAQPDRALRAWVQLLRVGGRLVVTTPNRRHLFARATGIERVVNPEHLFEYSPAELRTAVTRAGARVDSVEGLCLPLPVRFPQHGWRDLVRVAVNRTPVTPHLLARYFTATRRWSDACENLCVVATRVR